MAEVIHNDIRQKRTRPCTRHKLQKYVPRNLLPPTIPPPKVLTNFPKSITTWRPSIQHMILLRVHHNHTTISACSIPYLCYGPGVCYLRGNRGKPDGVPDLINFRLVKVKFSVGLNILSKVLRTMKASSGLT